MRTENRGLVAALLLGLSLAACSASTPEPSERTVDSAPWNIVPEAARARKPAVSVMERVEAFQVSDVSGDAWASATRYYAIAQDASACVISANDAVRVRLAPDSLPEQITCHWGGIGPAFHKIPKDSVSPFPDK